MVRNRIRSALLAAVFWLGQPVCRFFAQNAIEKKWKAPHEGSRGEELKSGVFCVLTMSSAIGGDFCHRS
jgi:hypothetical protein